MSFNGLTWGDGMSVAFDDDSAVTGIDDLPPDRAGNVQRGRGDGSILGPLFWGERTVTVPLVLIDDLDLPATIDNLGAATSTREVLPLTWDFGRGERLINTRCHRRALPTNVDQHTDGVARAVVQFVATDPNIYAAGIAADINSPGLHTVQTSAGTVSGGLGYSHGFPHGFGTATTGLVSVRNNGGSPAPWTATLKGPLSGPRIDLVGTTGVLELNGFDLLDGDTLLFDSRDRTVLLNGTASRYGSLTQAEWFDLPVGASQVQLTSTSGGSHSDALTLQWRDTWS